jgi:hypothetical protein
MGVARTMDTPVSVPDGKSYDLYLGLGERRVVWSYSDHGVTLMDDAIAWIADGRQSQVSFRDIVEVHLQLSYLEDNAIASCRLHFADGYSLSITSGNRRGFQDAGQDRLYVEFVYDLHARLAAHGDARAAFTAGFSEGRHLGLTVVAVVGVLLCVLLPVVLLLISGDWKMAVAGYTGLALLWPVYKAIQVNAPRSYDPRHVPEELMPVRLNLPPPVNPALLDID